MFTEFVLRQSCLIEYMGEFRIAEKPTQTPFCDRALFLKGDLDVKGGRRAEMIF